MTEHIFRQWLDDYLLPQQHGNAEPIKALFADDAVYWWGPYNEPRHGVQAIYEHHRNALSHQRDIQYHVEVLAVTSGYGLARFDLSLTDLWPGEPNAYEGIFQVFLNRDNRCTLFREWYNFANINKE